MRYMWLLAVGGAAIVGCEQGNPSPSVVGAWNLISWEQRTGTGEVSYPHGDNPIGQIIYTENGQMSAQLMNPEATLLDVTGLSADELLAQVGTMFFAYHGTYSVDEPAQTVTHHLQGSLYPTWVGTDQVREFEFLGDDVLQLTAIIEDRITESAGATGTHVLLWERVR